MFKVLSDFSPRGVRQSSLRKDREWDGLAGFFYLQWPLMKSLVYVAAAEVA